MQFIAHGELLAQLVDCNENALSTQGQAVGICIQLSTTWPNMLASQRHSDILMESCPSSTNTGIRCPVLHSYRKRWKERYC